MTPAVTPVFFEENGPENSNFPDTKRKEVA